MLLSEKRWKMLFYRNQGQIVRSLETAINDLLIKAASVNFQPDRLCIHYLRTSILNDTPFFRLDFLGQEKWNGETDCWAYWEIPIIHEMLQRHFPLVQNISSPNRKKEVAAEFQWLFQGEIIYAVMKTQIGHLWGKATKPDFLNGKIVFFGEYMGPYLQLEQTK